MEDHRSWKTIYINQLYLLHYFFLMIVGLEGEDASFELKAKVENAKYLLLFSPYTESLKVSQYL